MTLEELPEWIQVWRWYRATHPDDRRPFPQQPHYVGDELLDYDTARAAWLRHSRAVASLVAGTTAAIDRFEEAGIDAAISARLDVQQSPAHEEFLAFIDEANIAGGGNK